MGDAYKWLLSCKAYHCLYHQKSCLKIRYMKSYATKWDKTKTRMHFCKLHFTF